MKNRFNPSKALFALLLCITLIIPVLPAATAFATDPAPHIGTNVLTNGDFETPDLAGWIYTSEKSWPWPGTPDGNHYAVISEAGGNEMYQYIMKPIPTGGYPCVDSGHMMVTYSMSAMQGFPYTGYMDVEFIDNEGSHISTSEHLNPDSESFHTVSKTCAVPPNTRRINVELWNMGDLESHSMAVDDVSVVFSGDITPPSVTALSPTNGSHHVAPDAILAINYNEVVHAKSGHDIVIGGTSPITISVTDPQVSVVDNGNGTSTVQIRPSPALSPDSSYNISVPLGAFADPSENLCSEIVGSADWAFDTNRIRVQFDSQDGSSTPLDQYLYGGDTVASPTGVTKSGFTLEGWYTDTDFALAHKWNFSSGATGDMTLHAHWVTTMYYQVSTAYTGRGSVTGAGTYESGSSAEVKAIPARGYGFKHWRVGSTEKSTDSDYIFPVTESATYIADFVKLGTPRLTVTNTGYNSLKFSWNEITGTNYYQLQYREGRTGPWIDGSFPAGTTMPITIASLDCGQTYYFRVRAAYFTDGSTYTNGSWSSIKSAIPGTKVTVTSSGHGTVTGGGYYAKETTAEITATPRSGYYFKNWMLSRTVVSTDQVYDFPVSTPVTYKAVFAKIGTPSVRAASSGYQSIDLSWNPVAGATGYYVYESMFKNGPWDADHRIANLMAIQTTYTPGALLCGMKYYYRVQAYYWPLGGTQTLGSLSSVKSAIPVPAKPTNLSAYSPSTGSISLSWDAVDGATKYMVYRSNSRTGSYVYQGESTGPSFFQSGLTVNHTYYYKVRAVYVGGPTINGDLSGYLAVTPVDVPV